MVHCLIGSLLRLPPHNFLRVCCACLKYPEYNESNEYDKEEFGELGSGLGSFGTWGTCLGGLLRNIEFYVGVTPVGSDWPFNGGGGSFFTQCGTCTVDCVRTDANLLFDRDVLACAVIKYVITRISEVALILGMYDPHKTIFCNEWRSDILY